MAPSVRLVAALLLVAILAAPGAAATWRADLAQPLGSAPRLADSLLLSGALNLSATGASFAMPTVSRADFGRDLTVFACNDVGGEAANCTSSAQPSNTHARIRVVSGGFAAEPQDAGAALHVLARSGATMLSGGNLSANGVALSAASLVGGDVVATTDATALRLRPFGQNVTLQVLGDAGTQTYNTTAVTLLLTNATDVVLESTGVVVGSAKDARVDVSQAPLALAERGRGLDDLFALARAAVPLDQADRRADLATAFGPFQLVPAVLNGAAAARGNFTLNGAPQPGVVVLRLTSAQLALTNRTWSGSANASYVVVDGALAAKPGGSTSVPLLVPALLVLAALAGRLLTRRVSASTGRRRQAALVRLTGYALLFLVAEWLFAALFGFHPLANVQALSGRSLAQTLLLVGVVALVAYALAGLAAESLARSVMAWRGKPDALRLPALVGVVAALLFLVVSSTTLISAAAQVVRL